MPCSQRLNFRHECEEFLGRHLYKLAREDLDFVFASAKKIAAAAEDQLYIMAPMHAHERGLAAYLRMIAPQARDTGSNLIVFLNAYSNQMQASEFNAHLKRATEEVNAEKDKLGFDRIFLIERFFKDQPTMGRIRGLIADAAILTAYISGASKPLLVCNDIDTIRFSKTYLASYKKTFDLDPNVKMACGAVNFGYFGTKGIGLPPGTNVPELFVFNKLNKAIYRCARLGLINFERRLWMEGSNMAFSGAAYCACGGFDFAKTSGEDDELSRSLHRYNPNVYRSGVIDSDIIYEPDPIQSGVFNDDAWIVTNARRVLLAISEGLPGIEAWADLPFMETVGASLDDERLAKQCDAVEAAITSQMLRAARTGESKYARKKILDRLQYIVVRSIVYDRKSQSEEQFEAVLSELGIDRSNQDGSFLWNSSLIAELLNLEGL
jgi:hypothetical protein